MKSLSMLNSSKSQSNIPKILPLFLILILIILSIIVMGVDITAPAISYITPTSSGYTNNNYVFVNVSVSDVNDTTSFIDWDRSLVGWWRFNNDTDFTDWSTYSNDGTNSGSTYNASGKFGGARSFDGVNDYIDVGNDSSLNITDEITLEVWIYPTKELNQDITPNIQFVAKNYQYTFTYIGLGAGLGHCYLSFAWKDLADNQRGFGHLINLSANTWYHIVASFDGTNKNLYINGNSVSIDSDWGGSGTMKSYAKPVTLGAWTDGTTEWFNGTIDEVKIWNRVLSAQEINASYNTGIAGNELYRNFTSLSEGNYSLTAHSQDLAGNVNQTDSLWQFVDTTDPAISFVSPTSSEVLSPNTHYVFVNISVSDVNDTTSFIDWDRSLMGWWRMDDYNSTHIYDNSTHSNDGLISGATDIPGKFGRARSFNGSNKINCGSEDDTDLEYPITVEVWAKFDYDNVTGMIVSKGGDTAVGRSGYTLRQVNNAVYYYAYNEDGTRDLSAWTGIVIDTWYYIVLTIDGSNVKLFVNNDQKVSRPLIGYKKKDADFVIGSYTTDYFEGDIDEVRLWNRILSAQEMSASYNSGLAGNELYRNFTGLSHGNYSIMAHSQDIAGNVNQTAELWQYINDTINPSISFVSPTTSGYINDNFVYVNVSTEDASDITSFIDWNKSLVGWYRFNNNTDFTDWSTYSNDGTNSGSTYNTLGKFGGARSFDGSDQDISLGSDNSLNFTGAFTIESWINPSNSATWRTIIGRTSASFGGNANTDYFIGLTSAHKVRVYICNSTTQEVYDSSSDVSTSEYTHVVVSWDGTIDSNGINIYLNGILDKQFTSSVPSMESRFTTYISSPDANEHLNGSIDEVRIWNRALSAQEIKASYNTGLAGNELYRNFTSLSEDNYSLTAHSQDLAGNVNQTDSLWQFVDTTDPTITFISQTPSDLLENSTGDLVIIGNVSDSGSGPNSSSCVLARTVYDLLNDTYYWSSRVPSNTKAVSVSAFPQFDRIWRADGRNESKWFESLSILEGNIWKWAATDESNVRVSIADYGNTIQYIFNGSVENSAFPEMWFLDRTEMEASPKSFLNIYKDNPALIDMWHTTQHTLNSTNHILVYLNYSGTPTQDIDVYYINSSYSRTSDIKVTDSPNACKITSISYTVIRDYIYSPLNSSYILIVFPEENGRVCGVPMTDRFMIYFGSLTGSGDPYQIAISTSATSTNTSFTESGVLWRSPDKGKNYAVYAATPDLNYYDITENKQFQYKLYCCDKANNCDTSTLQTDTIGPSVYPPTTPSIQKIDNITDWNNTYVNGDINVSVFMASDPDGGPVTHNLSLVHLNGTHYLIINSSFVDGFLIDIPFNTSTADDGSYKLRVVAKDDENDTSTFTTTYQFNIDNTAPTTTATAVDDAGSPYTFNTWTNATYVNVTLSCNDGSGVGCNITQYCTDTINTCTPSTTYSVPVQISITSYIRFRSNDTLGNLQSTNSEIIKIDTTGPTINITSPVNDTHYNMYLTINATITDINSVDYAYYNITNSTGDVVNTSILTKYGATDYYNTTWDTTTVSDGNYTITIWANDSLDNPNAASNNFTIDNTIPAITWVTPKSDNTSAFNSSFNLDITFTDANLFKTLINITNSTGHTIYSNQTDDENVTTHQYTDLITLTVEGNYTGEASSSDDHTDTETDLKKGKKGETVLVFNSSTSEMNIVAYFVEKNDKPTDTPGDFVSSISELVNGEYKFGFNFTVIKPETKLILNLTATEKIYYRTPVSTILGHFVWDNYYSDYSDLPGDMDLTVTKVNEKNYILKIEGKTQWAKDQVISIDPVCGGLNLVTETVTFVYDTTPPTTTATAVKNDSTVYTFNTWTNSSYINVTLACSDTLAGCSVTLYCTDTANTCTPSTTYASPVQISTEGISYIRFRSNDSAGNMESTNSETIKIDTIDPTISIVSPGSEKIYYTTTLQLLTRINDSNLDSCWYSSNNGTNTSFNCVSATFGAIIGSNTMVVYANDSANNIVNASVTFTSTTKPPIGGGAYIPALQLSSLRLTVSPELISVNRTTKTTIVLVWDGDPALCTLVISPEIREYIILPDSLTNRFITEYPEIVIDSRETEIPIQINVVKPVQGTIEFVVETLYENTSTKIPVIIEPTVNLGSGSGGSSGSCGNNVCGPGETFLSCNTDCPIPPATFVILIILIGLIAYLVWPESEGD